MKLTETQRQVLRQVNSGEVYFHPSIQKKVWAAAVRACIKKGLLFVSADGKCNFTEKGFETLSQVYT